MMRAGVCSSPWEACWMSSCSLSSNPSDSPPPASSTAMRSWRRRSASSWMGSGGSLGSTPELYPLCDGRRLGLGEWAWSAPVEHAHGVRSAAPPVRSGGQALGRAFAGRAAPAQLLQRREHGVELAVDLRRPGLFGMVVERLEPVAGDDRNDGVVGAEAAARGELLEHRDRRAARRLGQDALGGGQQIVARDVLGVTREATLADT